MKNVWTGPVNASLVTSPPTPTGWAQDGIEGTQQATVPGAHWFNMVTSELMNVLSAAGVSANGGVFNQVASAISALIAGAIGDNFASGGTSTNGWQQYPDNHIEQWCQAAQGSSWGTNPVLVNVTYPRVFTSVSGVPRVSIYDSSSPGAGNLLIAAVQSYSLTGCVVQVTPNGGSARAFTLSVAAAGA
jgi:hypothetical protein